MANANRHFSFFSLATFTTAAAAVLTVAVLAHQPDLDIGSIALSIGPAMPMPEPSLARRADQMVINQLAVFQQHWTNSAGGEQ